MKISKTMVKYYLSYLTVGYFGDHSEPAEDFEDYRPIIQNIRLLAEGAGDLPWLKLALETILTDPNVDLTEYDGGHFPLSRDEVEQHLYYVWRALWPMAELSEPGEGPTVELEEMDADAWVAYRKSVSGR